MSRFTVYWRVFNVIQPARPPCRKNTSPPPSTVSIVRARTFGVTASKSCRKSLRMSSAWPMLFNCIASASMAALPKKLVVLPVAITRMS